MTDYVGLLSCEYESYVIYLLHKDRLPLLILLNTYWDMQHIKHIYWRWWDQPVKVIYQVLMHNNGVLRSTWLWDMCVCGECRLSHKYGQMQQAHSLSGLYDQLIIQQTNIHPPQSKPTVHNSAILYICRQHLCLCFKYVIRKAILVQGWYLWPISSMMALKGDCVALAFRSAMWPDLTWPDLTLTYTTCWDKHTRSLASNHHHTV